MSRLADFTFDSPGPWNNKTAFGPAMSVPSAFFGFKITGKFWVEFLDVGQHTNHVVFRTTFETPQIIDGTMYFGARISMEMANLAFEVLNEDETDYYYDKTKVSGDDYFSGQLSIKLLKYANGSQRQLKTLGFKIIEDSLTLGRLIDISKATNIYKFVFMPYRVDDVQTWKGCQDFVLQFWFLLVEKGIIEDKDDDGVSLIDVIAFLYAAGKEPRRQPVDKGEWPTTFSRVDAKSKVGNVYEHL